MRRIGFISLDLRLGYPEGRGEKTQEPTRRIPRSQLMKPRSPRVNRITLGLWLVAIALLVLVLVGVARGSAAARKQHCTHGVSSIGPMVIANGQAVSGSTTPHTQACMR